MTRPLAGQPEPLQARSAGAEAFTQALRYALAVTEPVTAELMPMPTPCRGWDLWMLLTHAAESLSALAEGFDQGCVSRHSAGGQARVAADPGEAFRQQARSLLGSLTVPDRGQDRDVVTVSGCPMATDVLAATGALEIAVHGWDIARACGSRTPIPAPLATSLLDIAPLLILHGDRDQLFAPPVEVARGACPSDRLAGYLGRSPR